MSNSFIYRWVCVNCRAIHYRKIEICRRCGCRSIYRLKNDKKLIEELKAGKKQRIAFAPQDVEHEPKSSLRNLKRTPATRKKSDDTLGKSGDETVQRSKDTDDLINDILEG